MEKLHFNCEDKVMEAGNVTGYVQIFLDEKPSVKMRFRHKVKVKFVFKDEDESLSNVSLRSSKNLEFANSNGQQNILKDIASTKPVTKHLQGNNVNVTEKSINNAAVTNSISLPDDDSIKIKSENISDNEGIKNNPETTSGEGSHLALYELHNEPGAKMEDPLNVQSNEMHASLTDDGDKPFSLIPETFRPNSSVLFMRLGALGAENENLSSEVLEINRDQTSVGLTCKLCNKSFKGTVDLHAHIKNPECDVKCKKCDLLCSCKAELFLHQIASHDHSTLQNQFPGIVFRMGYHVNMNSRSLSCAICGSISFSYFDMAEHINSFHFVEPIYRCCVCAERINSYSLYRLHNCKMLKRNIIVLECQSLRTEELLTSSANAKNISNYITEHYVMGESDDKIIQCSRTINDNTTVQSEYITSPKKCKARKKVKTSPRISISQDKKVKNEPRSCEYCKAVFKSPAELRSHTEIQDQNVSCGHCSNVFRLQAELIIHEHDVHSPASSTAGLDILHSKADSSAKLLSKTMKGKDKVPCPLCSVHVSRMNLVLHVMRSHTNEFGHMCCICNRPCRDRKEFTDHCRATHVGATNDKKTFQCSVCQKVCFSQSEMCSHQTIHYTVCHFCNEDFKNVTLLGLHYSSHHSDQMKQCSKCEKQFATERQLRTHERNHRYRFRKQCPKCGAMVYKLSVHISQVHAEEGQTFSCSVCSKTFTNEVSLQKHAYKCKNPPVGPFTCPECSKSFERPRGLHRHVNRVHLNKLHVCNVCGKESKSKYNLKVHMRIHSSQTLFNCELCGKGFKYNCSLQKHMMTNHKMS